MISVAILTFNDEEQIGRCLASIADLTDDIVVIDSFSSDRTLEICRRLGCRVFQNAFVDQATQFNWALDNVQFKYEWIMRLDSDEVVPKPLKKEIVARLSANEPVNGYYLNRRMYWMNRWLKHGRMYPHYILRLFRKNCGRYEQRTEEHLVLTGEAGYMRHDFLEDNRKNTLDYFTEKHLQTARGEISEATMIETDEPSVTPRLLGTKVQRTRWLKRNVYARTPPFLRAFLYFGYRYIVCLGFLDGVPGLIFHVLQGFWYRFYIDAKLYEKKSNWRATDQGRDAAAGDC